MLLLSLPVLLLVSSSLSTFVDVDLVDIAVVVFIIVAVVAVVVDFDGVSRLLSRASASTSQLLSIRVQFFPQQGIFSISKSHFYHR